MIIWSRLSSSSLSQNLSISDPDSSRSCSICLHRGEERGGREGREGEGEGGEGKGWEEGGKRRRGEKEERGGREREKRKGRREDKRRRKEGAQRKVTEDTAQRDLQRVLVGEAVREGLH